MKPNTVGRSHGDTAVVPAMEEIGLCADSIILTLNGETRVRDLRPGARVITRDSGTATLRGVDRRSTICRAVHIRAGSLGSRLIKLDPQSDRRQFDHRQEVA